MRKLHVVPMPLAGIDYSETFSGIPFRAWLGDYHDVRLADLAHTQSILAHDPHAHSWISLAEVGYRRARIVANMRDRWPDDLARLRRALAALHLDSATSYIGRLLPGLQKIIPLHGEMRDDIDRAVARKFRFTWPHPRWLKSLEVPTVDAEFSAEVAERIFLRQHFELVAAARDAGGNAQKSVKSGL